MSDPPQAPTRSAKPRSPKQRRERLLAAGFAPRPKRGLHAIDMVTGEQGRTCCLCLTVNWKGEIYEACCECWYVRGDVSFAETEPPPKARYGVRVG